MQGAFVTQYARGRVPERTGDANGVMGVWCTRNTGLLFQNPPTDPAFHSPLHGLANIDECARIP